MHRLALGEIGERGWYVPMESSPEFLEGHLRSLWDFGFRGLNLTNPLKERAPALSASQSPECRAIGAANTLKRGPGRGSWAAFNTDAPGFAEAYLGDLKPSPALVLGAGGAARAVLFALSERGFAPVVSSRTLERAKALAALFGAGAAPWGEEQLDFPLMVNAASASSPSELGESPPKLKASRNSVIVDVNYGRPDNHYQALAAQAGAKFCDGLPMLAAQARLSFGIWTGREDISPEPFSRGLREFFGS
jgi:shikimate dehydrogenase